MNETLNELLNEPKPVIFCFNKMDKLSSQNYDAIINENRKLEQESVFISALKKTNIDNFKQKIFEVVKDLHYTRFPFNKTAIKYI